MVNLVYIDFYGANKLLLANQDLNYLPDGLRYDIDCKYQLKDTDGDVHHDFKGKWSIYHENSILTECSNEHVFVLFRDNMVHVDMNYKEASFGFEVICYHYDDAKRRYHRKGEESKVERCGVHVFYVDAESFTVSNATSNINLSSDEDNRSYSPKIISQNSLVSQIVHSLGQLTIEEGANGEKNDHEDPATTISRLNCKRSYSSDDEEEHEPNKRVKLSHFL
ncbi:hypothetical protein COLO4_08790 [Corchorus olitorius]|uniref:Uncharacterized protein n=1 Tax=Corchorus olitorius TaxID=93759 RepID=A0A1R3KEL0_9ROSI|nr:hypothetical protein COLO4_08790 [Corchorus olitorius]